MKKKLLALLVGLMAMLGLALGPGLATPAMALDGGWCAASTPAICGKLVFNGPGPIYTVTAIKVQAVGVGQVGTDFTNVVVRNLNGGIIFSRNLAAVPGGSTSTFDIPNFTFGNDATWTMSGTIHRAGGGGPGYTMCSRVRGGGIGVNSSQC